ncbi:MAG: hypothetical protein QM628_16055 [Propionicimonas sp.]
MFKTNDIWGLTPRFQCLLTFYGGPLRFGVRQPAERLARFSIDRVGVGDDELVEERLVGQPP